MASITPSAPLKILMVTPEAIPLAKTGGLADVAGVLPRELARLGHDVRLILPGYGSIDRPAYGVTPWRQIVVPTYRGPIATTIERGLLPLGIAEGGEGTAKRGSGASSGASGLPGLPVLLVRHDPHFAREGLYQTGGTDYPDNLERFALFSRAVIELLRSVAEDGQATGTTQRTGRRGTEEADPWIPDILHLHDWQTALCAVYLRSLYANVPELRRMRTLLTIHNLGYQGVFAKSEYLKTGLGPELFTPDGLEYYQKVNLLKGGLLYADFLNTVSPTYSKEIQSPEFGFGLQGVIGLRKDRLRGIVNGIDVEVWNPATDPYLPKTYSVADLSGKRDCKAALQRELKLPVRPGADVPVFGIVSRFADQKGMDLVAEVLPELLELDVQVVILGTGDSQYELLFRALEDRHPRKFGLQVGFDEGLAHRIEAGADFFLMPSRYEPCGLNQQYSLRYGTIPIVSSTGGLADTVVPYSPRAIRERRATGFTFGPASAPGLLVAVLLALRVYEHREEWNAMMRAAMETDVSWTRSARAYVELYQEVLAAARRDIPEHPGQTMARGR
jgi:starch synthase